MTGFHSLGYPIFALFAVGLPVLLLTAGALVTVALARAEQGARRAGLWIALAASLFIFLDAALLRALPWLGLSFGPSIFSFVILLGVRLVLWIFTAALCIRFSRLAAKITGWLPFGLLNLAITGMVFYGFYIEPFRLETTRLEIPVDRLERPLRIVQISDLHVERTTRRERELVARVRDLQPDVIVLTGDYLNLSYLRDRTAIEDARWVFDQLSAPYGVYAVDGSVDGHNLMQTLFVGTQVQVISGQVEELALPGRPLYLIGVPDLTVSSGAEVLHTLSVKLPSDGYRLLLQHTPDLVYAAVDNGVDLYLAGHTHGGQICLPLYGALVTSSIYGRRFASGRYQVQGVTMYVSRGIGLEGGMAPRARFLAPPELVVVDLLPNPAP